VVRERGRERKRIVTGRPSDKHRTLVTFVYFCLLLVTFGKFSEFLASLVIFVGAAVGLWSVDCERCLW
jgi:hypothetical protein